MSLRRGPSGCMVVLVGALVVLAGLFFFGTFYTAKRRWVAGSRVGDLIRSHPPLRRALGECIAAYDPAALAAFNATGAYRTSGWFLPENRSGAVARCMSGKGWSLLPATLYTP